MALYLAGRGAEVHVIEPRTELSWDRLSPGKDLLMRSIHDLPTITLWPETTVEEIAVGSLLLQRHGKHERLEGIESTVVGGRVANDGLYEEILESMPDCEVYNVGDSVEPRDMLCASHEAVDAAQLIGMRATS